jgi:hypothetical protein
MTEAARLLVLKDVIGELERRGKTITRSESTLLTVDGVWVGVWVMPIMKRGAISKCVMRLGFGPAHHRRTRIEAWSGRFS